MVFEGLGEADTVTTLGADGNMRGGGGLTGKGEALGLTFRTMPGRRIASHIEGLITTPSSVQMT